MRLRIVSDGTPRNTRVEDAASGELLKGVQSVTWNLGSVKEMATVEICVLGTAVDLIGEAPDYDAVVTLCDLADEAQNVVHTDGTWTAGERIKDWFTYDTLEKVLRTAERFGWRRREDD